MRSPPVRGADRRRPCQLLRDGARREPHAARAAGRDRGLPLDEVAGAPRVTSVELAVRTRVPRLDKAGLARTVAPVAVLCPVSNAARGNVEITVRHQVDEA